MCQNVGRMSFLRSLSPERQTLLLAIVGLSIFLLITGLYPDLGKRRTPTSALQAGKTIDVSITLVTADSNDLACAGNDVVEGARCAFVRDGSPASAQGPVLAPYMTLDNVLFLIPDLWSEPALAQRLAEDPPNVPRDRLRRFTARCKFTAQQVAKDFYVRWQPNQDWSHRRDAWVGSISGCRID